MLHSTILIVANKTYGWCSRGQAEFSKESREGKALKGFGQKECKGGGEEAKLPKII